MKKLEKNPIYLYMGQPCVICDTDEPVPDIIEGCDFVQDQVICERVNWDPNIIKPVLRDISDMTLEEALEVANLVWFALGHKKINSVEIKTTPLFPYASIYFDWVVDDVEEIDKFILSLDNAHHTIKLFRIDIENNDTLIPMQVYQSHKVTAYLLGKGFNLGILEEESYIIRNQFKK